MAKFSDIRIIYNPKSTGDSKAMAFELRDQLQKSLPSVVVKCMPTKYAGHARIMAGGLAKKLKRPLIVSSSGDGGYNEVVNGIMDAGATQAVAAVLPAGNANDHSRTMQDKPLVQQIVKGKVTKLDLLVVSVFSKSENYKRYAHSYAGLGITPAIGQELNKHELNKFNEILIAIKTFKKFKPFKIKHQGKILKLDSLLFGNINQMAKILTISPKNKPNDGLFEVVTFKNSTKVKLVRRIAKAAALKLDTTKRLKLYKFETINRLPMQLDGEIISLPAGSIVNVESAHKILNTIV